MGARSDAGREVVEFMEGGKRRRMITSGHVTAAAACVRGARLESAMIWLGSVQGMFAHQALELLGYVVGARLYWREARTWPRPSLAGQRLALLAGAVFGAFVGSKLLHVAEHGPALMAANDPALWWAGKSVLGGFIGGTLGVEFAKRAVGWSSSTGDAWVTALAAGLLIGRLGCQLSGPWDQTYGIPTHAAWGWDYGDGVLRHPTALYEILLVGLLWATLRRFDRQARPGAAFAAFLLGYCVIRFGLEFLKPPFGRAIAGTLPTALYGPLTAIQWTALAGVLGYGLLLRYRLRAPVHG